MLWFKANKGLCICRVFFIILFLSNYITFGLPRYDFIFVCAILIQIILVLTKIETVDEVKTILLFHILGFSLEIFKTSSAIASWSYPEFGYFKLLNVPLYSGFMYAAVGSYISQAWRLFDLKLINPPSYKYTGMLSVVIYLNFFTHHYIYDFRYFLILLVILIFFKTNVQFAIIDRKRQINMVLSFFLIAIFIWIAEDIATFLGAWKYSDQLTTWSVVSFHKIESWSLLVIISFMLIAQLKHVKTKQEN